MWTQLMKHDSLAKLKTSRFRRKFRLKALDRQKFLYCGETSIRQQARELIRSRLSDPAGGSKITPYHGHPVFVAQHATGTCCRRCLLRWHRIPAFRELEDPEVDHVVDLIMRWLKKEIIRT